MWCDDVTLNMTPGNINGHKKYPNKYYIFQKVYVEVTNHNAYFMNKNLCSF